MKKAVTLPTVFGHEGVCAADRRGGRAARQDHQSAGYASLSGGLQRGLHCRYGTQRDLRPEHGNAWFLQSGLWFRRRQGPSATASRSPAGGAWDHQPVPRPKTPTKRKKVFLAKLRVSLRMTNRLTIRRPNRRTQAVTVRVLSRRARTELALSSGADLWVVNICRTSCWQRFAPRLPCWPRFITSIRHSSTEQVEVSSPRGSARRSSSGRCSACRPGAARRRSASGEVLPGRARLLPRGAGQKTKQRRALQQDWHQRTADGALQRRPQGLRARHQVGPAVCRRPQQSGRDFLSAKKVRRRHQTLRRRHQAAPGFCVLLQQSGRSLLLQKGIREGQRELTTRRCRLDPDIFERTSHSGVLAQMSSPGDRAHFYYVLARLYAQSGVTDRSLQYLRRAMEEGYKGINDVYKDAEFAGLRKDPALYRADGGPASGDP